MSSVRSRRATSSMVRLWFGCSWPAGAWRAPEAPPVVCPGRAARPAGLESASEDGTDVGHVSADCVAVHRGCRDRAGNRGSVSRAWSPSGDRDSWPVDWKACRTNRARARPPVITDDRVEQMIIKPWERHRHRTHSGRRGRWPRPRADRKQRYGSGGRSRSSPTRSRPGNRGPIASRPSWTAAPIRSSSVFPAGRKINSRPLRLHTRCLGSGNGRVCHHNTQPGHQGRLRTRRRQQALCSIAQ